jgi:hypothetical protein
MRNLLISVFTSSLLVVRVFAANPSDRRSDIEKPVALAKAVEEFNKKYPDKNPLTEDEVIAAVRQIRRAHPGIPEDVFQLYQKVVAERILPPGFYLSRMTRLIDGDWEYEVDWKHLTFEVLPQHKFPPELKLSGFNYRIRARFISCKPRSSNDRTQAMQQIQLRLQEAKKLFNSEAFRKAQKELLRRIRTEPQGDFWIPGEFERLRDQADPAKRG